MSSFASFNSLFRQPSDPLTHPEFACKYERGMRKAEAELLECSVRYGGVSILDGGAKLEPIDTTIPRDTVASPPPSSVKRSFRRIGSSLIADCVSPKLNCLDGLDDFHDEQLEADPDTILAPTDSQGSASSSRGPAAATDENSPKEGNGDGGGNNERSSTPNSLLTPAGGEKSKTPTRPGSAMSGNSIVTTSTGTASHNSVHTKPDDESIHVHAIRVTSPYYENLDTTDSEQPQQPQPPLVLLHGYANGALYFYRNLHGLSRHFPTIYSVDMLGWGLSSRPTWATRDDTTQAAEDFFVEALEAWRAANGIECMVLGGHSLGGYICVAYCERYPDNVDKLLLLSPVGIQDVPEPTSDANTNANPVSKLAYGVAKSFFSNGWTPGAVIRAVSEWKGRMGVERYVDNRLPVVKCPQERTALIDYLYNNAVLPPSGEGCLNRLLRPGAYAINPCCHRIPRLKVGEVVFIYGAKDWMDPRAGLDVERYCKARRAEGDLSVPDVTVHAVRNAGHLLMIENWEGCNAAVVLSCKGSLDGELAVHRPASFADKQTIARYAGKMVSAGSETTEESGGHESVEIDVTGRYIVEEEEDFVEYGKEATWTESCTGVSIRKPSS